MNLRPSGYEPDELPNCSTPRYSIYKRQLCYLSGRRRIRTFEVVDNRFTVCPLWPLGNPSMIADDRTRTDNLLITNQLLCQLSHIGILNGWRWIRTTEATCNRFTVCPLWPLGNPSINFLSGAYRARTCDPLLVRQMLSQLS